MYFITIKKCSEVIQKVFERTEPDVRNFSLPKKKARYIFSNLIINLSQCLNKDKTKATAT